MITDNRSHPSVIYWIIRKMGLLSVGLAALLTGCGGGSSSSSGSGDVSISLTDASGDFAAYSVDIASLQLVKQNGAKISALPTTTRVDFTRYTDLSELLAVATVPAGNYTRVILNLDYSNADVEVEDSAGVHKATLLNGNGAPLGSTVSVTLELASGNPLVIAPGVPASLALDFDLGASNQVITTNPAVVQVEPFLVADLSLDTGREHRARGLLKDVDSSAQTFEMHLRPFAARGNRNWGLVTVAASPTTHYEIDGAGYVGAAGLNQLGALQADTPLIVTGTVAGKKLLDATEVLAGSSVPWTNKDAVQGTVIKRTGDTLTVRGHYVNRTDGIAIFNSDIAVSVDSATKITAPLSNQTGLDKDSISVGQAITALGTLDLNSTPYALDSTGSANLVRMNVTQLKGIANNLNGGLLNTDLAYIEGRRIDLFDFSGTGTSSAEDSDPGSYDVDTGQLLAGTTIPGGDIVKVRGFVAPFGQASSAGDFSAIAVIDLNRDVLAANLALRWLGGTSSPFTGITADGIDIDLSGVDNGNLWLAGVGVDLSGTTAITLQPQDPANGHYAIKQRGQAGISFYKKFADFSAALTTALGDGAKVALVVAHGGYSSADAILNSSGALVLLTR